MPLGSSFLYLVDPLKISPIGTIDRIKITPMTNQLQYNIIKIQTWTQDGQDGVVHLYTNK